MKKPEIKDAVILEALQLSVQYAQEHGADKSLFDALTNRTNTVRSLGNIALPPGHDAIDLCKRYLKLRNLAYAQNSRIIHAARIHMEEQGVDKEHIALALSNTRALGRVFGRIGGSMNDENITETADVHYVNYMLSSPSISFLYTPENGITFSEHLIRQTESYVGADTGCPAMAEVYEWGGERQTLYDYFWDMYSAQYLNDYNNDVPFEYYYLVDNDQ